MLTLTRDGTCAVVAERDFAATPRQIWDAHVDPAQLIRWMPAPEGWALTTCDPGARSGDLILLEWSNGLGSRFALTGAVLEVDPPHRMLHVERLHLPEPGPETVVETRLTATATGCHLTLTLTLPDTAAREALIAGDAAQGMETGYAALDSLLA
ncbi:MAG: SRPBCC domain-containing protein [Rhodobacter sp.]|nr:SRPBCC domain-containing protein [Rhodobacter sp.]